MKKLTEITDWKEMINEVVCADCLEGMKLIPDKSIDLVLTDPPYGLGIDGQKRSVNLNPKYNRKEHEFLGWDSSTPSNEYFNELFRISKNQIIFGANYFTENLQGKHKGWRVWDKGQRDLTMSDCELIYTSFDCPTRIITFNRIEILKDGSVHPTQKPLELIRTLIEMHTEEGNIICDPFMGSWTTARACKDLGRNFIGFEISEKYCKIGEERLRQELLF